MLDLILPLECGGCGMPATPWCDACARQFVVQPDEPHLITPRIDPLVPVFALGRYGGARRRAILAMKEQGRADLVAPLARALALGVHRLLDWGIVETPLTIVPAPTRRSAARRRGGDPVARVAAAAVARHPDVTVRPVLRLKALSRDSVGLDPGARERNVAGRVLLRGRWPRSEVLLVDDVVTTGATARESVRVLTAGGVAVTAVLALAAA
ncbi:ComF family protein [Mycobacterium sherrisii]|uniref:Phosphoribosyltransferase n=1 Tax=Mycobacterium sherrisii TaxID=243061 RepID=A0A1E3SIJ5_9MYCO|nr:ComF family protein [Mycobacterium sherrisii]MCV7028008.1 ComF family protein [Mycobacterium sherrisii]MEC4765102.1 ComF family protein [Mycobacterium sherrisii]ODR01949.1 phosphoribosyltransferase [Mycobacterium sherrisii]ORW84559.1 phosphoribosyltransferase [Mycobacterium sherrisii]